MTANVPLFSYGTLQQREVQLATYHRLLTGEHDVLPRYRLESVAIGRDDVVEISGKAVHTIARWTGDPNDRIAGTLYWLTQAELDASDAYEDSAYTRAEAALESGRRVFVYVGAPLGEAP